MRARHPKRHQIIAMRLFDGVEKFTTLEGRIAALNSNKERGDAFEVFAEAYLATQKMQQVREVWPANTAPQDLASRLRLPVSSDMGSDGVFQKTDEQLCIYQVKFRTGRPALTWRELSTFFGIAEAADERVLITNSNTLPDIVENRGRFHCIRGNDLDRLAADDFEAIRAWIDDKTITPELKTPEPHQDVAIERIVEGFVNNDRVTSIMACGTGKTLVALWVAERIAVQRIIVLLPSLALLRQTLHEWLHETTIKDIAYLCVCSDPTVTSARGDDIATRQSDLDFPIDTSIDTVRSFLRSDYSGMKIIYTTYHSAHIVGEAMGEDDYFDIGIFDEAHKTAGREGAKFTYALSDEKLMIRKRLFMTATPRHYDISKRDKEGAAKQVFSMDVPETYGPRVHTLTFSEAAAQEIICDYRVIISIVNSNMINDELLRRGETIIDGDLVRARHVATQIALQRAVEEHNLRRVFTFHKSVAVARSFTSEGAEGISTHLPDFQAFHVNGKMTTALRDSVIGEFKTAERAVISNARCLTEGVDVPAVDLVGFMSPKRSRVDIVQAAGRAMRRDRENPEKTFGYILLPLFIEETAGESLNDALDRTDFREVWDVLQAMQEHDDVLAEIIRHSREERGRSGIFDKFHLEERVEILGPIVELDALQYSISTRLIDYLGSNWDERYGRLVAYKDTHGDCNVPSIYEPDRQLGNWVSTQRQSKIYNQLNDERIDRLDALGFVWHANDHDWDEMYGRLVAYKEVHGDCNVSVSYEPDQKLSNWVRYQRKNNNQLNDEQIDRLDALGFVWDVLENHEIEMYNRLVAYKEVHGDCNVPASYKPDQQLANWVGTLRQRYKNPNGLSGDKVGSLDALGFVWVVRNFIWIEMYDQLVAYKETHGDCNVPASYEPNPNLAVWLNLQRTNKTEKKHKNRRITLLDELGVDWSEHETVSWDEMYDRLVVYKENNGDCNVPINSSRNPQLANWVQSQRTRCKSPNGLSSDKVDRLDALGFVWDIQEHAWIQMYIRLIAYKKIHGNCNVPFRYKSDQKLSKWIRSQRRTNKIDKLSSEKRESLNKIGFVWEVLFKSVE